MRQSSRSLLASLLLICAKASADDKSAEALLQQMQSAVSQQNFELSMVKARQGRLEPIRFSHGVIDGKEVPKDWLEGMQLAGSNKNVFCKVSALAEGTRKTMGDAPKEVEFYKPVLDSLWNVFGEDRLIFGSNWPVSVRAATYETIHKIVHTYFSMKGKVAGEKYFMKNALAAYRPPTRG